MNKAVAACTVMAMLLAAGAEAGPPLTLTERQMDIVTAGSALAASLLELSASGQSTATRSWVGNIAAGRPNGDVAQSRAAFAASGNSAALSGGIVNRASAGALTAGAASSAAASGDHATIAGADVTTAIDAPAGFAHIGIADSLSTSTSFSAGKTAR